MSLGRTGSSSRCMPRAIAPEVTTTTSVPRACSAATSSQMRATVDRRSSPESSATMDEPSLTTTTGMAAATIESRPVTSASSPPEVRATHREGHLTGVGGRQLYWQGFEPDGEPRAAVVIAHGASEHGGRYRYAFERLVPEGFAVYAIDH